MGFGEAISTVFGKYATFSGRARRSEYWWWILFVVILNILSSVIDVGVLGATTFQPVSTILALGLFLPGLAVSVRRLHDRDRSGWWILIGFIPIIGFIVLLIWFVQRGTEGPNDYGPDPVTD